MLHPRSHARQYRVEVSEWGARTFVIVNASDTLTAIKQAKQNAGKAHGWEGVRNVYGAYPIALA
ncbi:MAG: hypothetical protein AAGH78_13175 [Cyanobacteria bacterium P01_H01_bin.58]